MLEWAGTGGSGYERGRECVSMCVDVVVPLCVDVVVPQCVRTCVWCPSVCGRGFGETLLRKDVVSVVGLQ